MTGLEALERVKTLLDYQIVSEDISIIEKELKALEIIKKKMVDMNLLVETFTYPKNGLKAYNGYKINGYNLTQEEYDLLKEVLL